MHFHLSGAVPTPGAVVYAPAEATALSAGHFRSSAATHPGAVRRRNEDNYVSRPDLGLWAVADGAGGHEAGDVASCIVTDALRTVPTGLGATELLGEIRHRIAGAHVALWAEAARRGRDAMCVSTVVVLLARQDYYACLWAGDSRAYLLRGGRFRQLTRDHSLVQELFDAGAISAADIAHHPSANVITRAVGAEDLELDKVTDRLHPGDRFLLCSDGLFRTVPEPRLAETLAAGQGDIAERMVTTALARHAGDNVTAVTVEVLSRD
jgi:serine/threonine-protein phosphatase Stp1